MTACWCVGDRQWSERDRRGSSPRFTAGFRGKAEGEPLDLRVEDMFDKQAAPPFNQPLSAERLVKLDMPALELSADQPRWLEMREKPTDQWNTYVIEKFGVDGRVQLILEGGGWIYSCTGKQMVSCSWR